MDDFLHVLGLSLRSFHNIIERLAARDRRRQGTFPGLFRLVVQITLGHDIGKGSVHGKQFRHILKLGEAAFQLVVNPRCIQLPRVCNLPESGSPGVEVLNLLVF